MSIRTAEALYDSLAADLIWRKKELTVFKLLTEEASPLSEKRRTLLRGAVALLYAHWEGFIKTASASYLEFVFFQRLAYRELAPNFLALSLRSLLRPAGASNRIGAHIAATEFFLRRLSERSSVPYKNAISTQANLSSRILEEIIATLGLDFAPFATKEKLLDEGLLAHRNTIAHGEFLLISYEEYDDLSGHVLAMMEEFSTQIANAAVLRRFAAAA